MMAGIEDKVNSLFQTVEGLVENNSRLEGQLLHCQEDVLALRKFKFESKKELDQAKKDLDQTKNHLDQTNKDLDQTKKDLDQTKKDLDQTKNDLDETKKELDQTKKDLDQTKNYLDQTNKDLDETKNDLDETKKDLGQTKKDLDQSNKKIQKLEATVRSERDVKRLSRKLEGVDDSVNTLTEKVTEESKRLDITDQKVDRLQRVFNRVHEATQSGHDLREEVDNIKCDVTRLNSSMQLQNQQQQATAKPTQQSSASMAPEKRASDSTPLTRQQLDELQTKSKFNVYNDYSTQRLQTGSGVRMRYDYVYTPSEFLDTESGVYKTPTRGKYRFRGWMGQEGSGRCDLYLCEDREGKRELLVKTESDGDWCGRCVEWDCEQDVCVWLEVVRVQGHAEVRECVFKGWLLS